MSSTTDGPVTAGSGGGNDIERIHYIVELTVPWKAPGRDGAERAYNRNLGIDVIADDLIQAAHTALQRFPDGVLHVVRKVGASTRLLVAPMPRQAHDQ